MCGSTGTGNGSNGNRIVVVAYVRVPVMLDNAVIDLSEYHSGGNALSVGNNTILTVDGIA